MAKIGLVTVLYNSNELLDDFFLSISLQDYTSYVLYLVDNTPNETTRTAINELQQKYALIVLKHIECEKNLGAAEGNNIGIKNALEDGCGYLILLNNDIYFTNGSLFSSLVSIAEKNDLPIIAPKIYYSGTDKIWYGGGEILTWRAGARHLYDKEKDYGQADKSCFTGYAPTTFMFLRRDIFSSVTKLDPQYFIYVEDLDFIYRASKAGYRIWYEAGLHLNHKVSITTGGILSDKGFYYNTRNRVYFARKFFFITKSTIAIFYVFASLFYHALRQKKITAVKSFLDGFVAGFKLPIAKDI